MSTSELDHSTDAELVAACISGSEAAWHALIERHTGLVAAIAHRSGLDAEDRDDVFQTVWTLAVRHLPSMRDGQGFASWLITTTRRECWRRGRSLARDRVLGEAVATMSGSPASGDAHEAVSDDPGAEYDTDYYERRLRLRSGFARLGARCRDLLDLVFRPNPLPYDRVAELLGIPRGSIGPQRARCLEQLRGIVSDEADPAGTGENRGG